MNVRALGLLGVVAFVAILGLILFAGPSAGSAANDFMHALQAGDVDRLTELSYVAGEDIRLSVKPWDPRDARDYYLGSAVYAWLYLFGEGIDAQPGAFDRRYREACDFYNYGLGLALLEERRSTNATVHLESGPRRLPE